MVHFVITSHVIFAKFTLIVKLIVLVFLISYLRILMNKCYFSKCVFDNYKIYSIEKNSDENLS